MTAMVFQAVGKSQVNDLAFCSVVSKNYLSQARALAESLARVHPGSPFYVLLVDRVDGYFDPEKEPFTVVPLEDLAIPNLPRFCFQYNVLELNTAAKPFFFAHLFQHHAPRKLVYFDPDILVLRSLDSLADLLGSCSLALTPHVTQPFPLDGKCCDEVQVLLTGTYNLGFLGMGGTDETARFLKWWQERLYRGCQACPPQGMFVDQKWMDLAPCYFEHAHVLREHGYNIAYWNMHYRHVQVADGQVRVNGTPAYFFHFSGFTPRQPEVVSKYQSRLSMDDVGDARILFRHYSERLEHHGFEQTSTWPYRYHAFDNGCPIPDEVRRVYLQLGEEVDRFDNPFVTQGPHSFYQWIHDRRPDLVERYQLPNPPASKCAPQSLVHFFTALQSGPSPALPFGINVIDALEPEAEAHRELFSVRKALEEAAIPFLETSLRTIQREEDQDSGSALSAHLPYAVNLVLSSADHAGRAGEACARLLPHRYNIGLSTWDLSFCPPPVKAGFLHLDEIWTPSIFSHQALTGQSPVPVFHVPYAASALAELPPGFAWPYFGLTPGRFVFLSCLEGRDIWQRLSPTALVSAFCQAFSDCQDVALVMQVNPQNLRPDEQDLLANLCHGHGNIHLLERATSWWEMDALLHLSNVYVSLHRSLGSARTIVDAMALGKPVIATAYSAPAELMSLASSCPVRYRLEKIDTELGRPHPHAMWAQPNIAHAAEQMRRLHEDRALGARLGAQARQDTRWLCSPARIGELLHSRLASIGVRAGSLPRPDLKAGSRIGLDTSQLGPLLEAINQRAAA